MRIEGEDRSVAAHAEYRLRTCWTTVPATSDGVSAVDRARRRAPPRPPGLRRRRRSAPPHSAGAWRSWRRPLPPAPASSSPRHVPTRAPARSLDAGAGRTGRPPRRAAARARRRWPPNVHAIRLTPKFSCERVNGSTCGACAILNRSSAGTFVSWPRPEINLKSNHRIEPDSARPS